MADLALERALARDRRIVGGCLALLVVLACLWLWRDRLVMAAWDQSMAAMDMKGMEMEGGPMATSAAPAAYLAEAFVMWLIMMVAMMLPSAAPMILIYGKLARSAARSLRLRPSPASTLRSGPASRRSRRSSSGRWSGRAQFPPWGSRSAT